MNKFTHITKEGLENLKKELDRLIFVERPSIARQIAEARDKGDLSENAEYHAAKDAQGLLEIKIAKLQESLRNARIIDTSNIDSSKVLLLSTVKVKNLNTGTFVSYTLVPEQESDLKAGKISINSPIAKGLLGKKAGEQVEVQVPAGKIPFEIIEITR